MIFVIFVDRFLCQAKRQATQLALQKAKLQDAFEQAIEMKSHPDHKHKSIRQIASEVAEACQVNPVSLRTRLCRLNSGSSRQPRQTKLTAVEELIIVGIAKACSVHIKPLVRTDLLELANSILLLRDPPEEGLTYGWVTSFLQRHVESIKLRIAKYSKDKTILASRLPVVLKWVDLVDAHLRDHPVPPERNFNIDETKALVCTLDGKVIGNTKTIECQDLKSSAGKIYTLVSVASASGDILFLLYIFKAPKRKDPTKNQYFQATLSSLPHKMGTRANPRPPIYYAFTPGGYMNGSTWKSLTEIFAFEVQKLQGSNRNLSVRLWIDGCSSHKDIGTLKEVEKYNIDPIFFPSDTSHFLQPLDGQPFAVYKPKISRKIREALLSCSLDPSKPKLDHITLSVNACLESFTPQVLKSGFQSRGVCPFDRDKIISNCLASTGDESDFESLPASVQDHHIIRVTSKLIEGLKSSVNSPPPGIRVTVPAMNCLFNVTTLETAARNKALNKKRPRSPTKLPKLSKSNIDNCEKSIRNRVKRIQKPKSMTELFTEREETVEPKIFICSACSLEHTFRSNSYECPMCNNCKMCSGCASSPINLVAHNRTCVSAGNEAVRSSRKTRPAFSFKQFK